MTAILAIDAAWTCTEPSGVGVLARTRRGWRCGSVAPSYEAFIASACGTRIDWAHGRFRGSAPDVPRLLDAATTLAGVEIDLVAIDMPVARLPVATRRIADNAIAAAFSRHGCGTHSPTARRPGVIATQLTHAFARAGYPLLVARGARSRRRGLIEVYPHPALLSLLGVSYRVPYKVGKSTRYWPSLTVRQRIDRLLAQFRAIRAALAREIRDVRLPLPRPGAVPTLAALKRYEDALDALVCGWVGIQFAAGRAVAYGDATAAVWVPADSVTERSLEGRPASHIP